MALPDRPPPLQMARGEEALHDRNTPYPSGDTSNSDTINPHPNNSGDSVEKRNRNPENQKKRRVALACPGGGIRSAAFCHGVLNYFINHMDVFQVEALSCVSGGGYLGSSFVQQTYIGMKYEGMSYEEAARKFFSREKMNQRAGYLLNCQRFHAAVLSTIALVGVVFGNLFFFLLDKIPLWIVFAFLVDVLFGDDLRDRGWSSLSVDLIIISGITGVLWILWFLLAFGTKNTTCQRIRNFLSISFGIMLSMLWIVILTKISREPIQSESNGLVFLIVLLLRPIFRHLSPIHGFFRVVVYCILIAEICHWRVYRDPSLLWRFSYSDRAFNILLLVSGIILAFPVKLLQRSLVHYYYSWRLQKAFYIKTGYGGCSGLFFGKRLGGIPVRLKDLGEEPYSKYLPAYIATTAANGWKKEATGRTPYHVMTLESGGKMTLLGIDDSNDDLTVDVGFTRLSTTMALSAAALAIDMGPFQLKGSIRFWQIIFGFGLGNWVYTKEPPRSRYWIFTLRGAFPLVVILVFALPLPNILVLIPFIGALVLLFLATVFPPNYFPALYYIPTFVYMYELLNLIIYGGDPLPPQVYLSDGAFSENMAVLPLLAKRKYETIVICDGSEDRNDVFSGLTEALAVARRKLGCSFLPIREEVDRVVQYQKQSSSTGPSAQQQGNSLPSTNTGNTSTTDWDESTIDIEEFLKKFLKDPKANSCKIRVNYRQPLQRQDTSIYAKQNDVPAEEEPPLNSSVLIVLKARRGFAESHPDLFPTVELNGCCFESCHNNKHWNWTKAVFGEFPQTLTANQFFTRTQFDQYDLLGYETAYHHFRTELDSESAVNSSTPCCTFRINHKKPNNSGGE